MRSAPQRHWRDLEELDAGALRIALTAAKRDPIDVAECMRIACAAETSALFSLRSESLDAVAQRDPENLDLLAELAMDAARAGEPDRADSLAGQLIHRTEDPRLRGRALHAQAGASAWRGGSAGKVQAEASLAEAADLLLTAGEVEWAAAALMSLGWKVAYLNGDLDRANENMRRAIDVVARPNRTRALVLSLSADTLAVVGAGREAEAVALEAAAIGRRFGDHRVQAYAAWGAAAGAAVRGDKVALIEHLHEVRRHPGDWYGGPAGAEFLAAAADLLGRLGDAATEEWLQSAEEAANNVGYPEIAAFARAAYEARVGDPAFAEPALLALARSDEVPPREHWRVLLLRAVAAARRADPAAEQLEARARTAASQLGYPQLPELHEPVAVRLLSQAAAPAQPRAAVNLMGGFEVTLDGVPVDLDPGQSTGLVAYLALGSGERSVEEVLDALWPDVADLDAARARLRTLLYRIRRDAADLIVRQGDTLRLAAALDLTAFVVAARRALAASGDTRLALVDSALGAYGGDLLPGLRYADWAAADRERVRRTYLALLDLGVRLHTEANHLDSALGLVQLAIDIEPLDEARYVTAADLARRLGNQASAGNFEALADSVRHELGLDN